jgi:hypothetical protein
MDGWKDAALGYAADVVARVAASLASVPRRSAKRRAKDQEDTHTWSAPSISEEREGCLSALTSLTKHNTFPPTGVSN